MGQSDPKTDMGEHSNNGSTVLFNIQRGLLNLYFYFGVVDTVPSVFN